MSNPSSTLRKISGLLTLPAWLHVNQLYRKRLVNKSGVLGEGIPWEDVQKGDRATPLTANIISSVVHQDDLETIHVPLLDLDIKHHYEPSSTRGHAHLYLDVELTHSEYEELLTVLAKFGIIQNGILKQFKRDGMTTLRLPGMKKGSSTDEPDKPQCKLCADGEPHHVSHHNASLAGASL